MKRILMSHFFVLIFCAVARPQTTQPKTFHVNSYQFIDTDYNKDLEFIEKGFDVTITAKSINIGDSFDLAITKSTYDSENKFTHYWVEDKAKNNRICSIIVGIDESGENYLQVHSCDSNGKLIYKGGIVFRYWDHVSNYDLWRVRRAQN